jgi:hypothetical protein
MLEFSQLMLHLGLFLCPVISVSSDSAVLSLSLLFTFDCYWNRFQRAIHSILATRMILHLRKVAAVGDDPTLDLQYPPSPLGFAGLSTQRTTASV